MNKSTCWNPDLVLRRNLILLQLPVRHFVGPGAQNFLRKSDYVNPQRHPATQALAHLSKCLRRTERAQSAGEILQRILIEIEIRVVGEKRAIDFSLLQVRKDLLRLFQLRRSSRVIRRE